MEWVEVRGDDVAAAEELALDQLGVAREDAEFEVVTAPENKWLGLKKTEARVRARVKPVGPKSKKILTSLEYHIHLERYKPKESKGGENGRKRAYATSRTGAGCY